MTDMERLRASVQPVLRAVAVYGSGCAGLGAAIADGNARPPNEDGTPLVPIEPVERAAMLVVAEARVDQANEWRCDCPTCKNHLDVRIAAAEALVAQLREGAG